MVTISSDIAEGLSQTVEKRGKRNSVLLLKVYGT